MQEIEIPMPSDFHIHLRQGELLGNYVRSAVRQFGRFLVMPNTNPPIDSAERIAEYKKQILAYSRDRNVEILMTFKLNRNYTQEELTEMRASGAIAGKFYPLGATTNSEDGILKISDLYPTFELMEKMDFVLCLHGEEPNAFCLEREAAFLKYLEDLYTKFPKLRIVFEHVSSEEAVKFVASAPATVAATITVHHLLLNLDDVIGDTLRPHYFCKPIPKHPMDMDAVRKAAFSGNPKFFLGTDSAPHTKTKKECECGAAGVYSAPVAMPILLREFEKENKLDLMANFTSGFGADFYKLQRPSQIARFVKNEWFVPKEIDGAVPLCAGEVLEWSYVCNN